MSYSSASDVAILTPHLLGTASDFTTSTSPTLAAVNSWLSSGCAVINGKLAAHGYGAIPAGNAVYGIAQQAEATYGAWFAERSRLSARVARDENTRDTAFRKDFFDLLNQLVSIDLTTVGVSRTSAPPATYAGGVSIADKEANEGDSDIVQGRFRRGIFRNTEALTPSTSGS